MRTLSIRSLKDKSVFSSWLISYFLLLLMPIIISTIVYVEAYRIVERDITYVNEKSLKQIQMSIDSGLQDISKFGVFLSFNQNLYFLMQEKNRDKLLNNYYLAYRFINELKSYNLTSGYVDDFFIYLKQSDLILTTNGSCEAEYFYQRHPKGAIYKSTMSYDEWKEAIVKAYTGEYLTLGAATANTSKDVKNVIYIKSLPIMRTGQTYATFAISLNNKRFNDAISSISSLNGGWGVILDKNSTVLFSTRPLLQPFPLKYDSMPSNADILDANINNEDVKVSYITSNVENWKYISIISTAVFEEKVKYIRNLIIISIFSSILLGGIVSFFFSRRNYKPINKLVQSIAKKAETSSTKGYNEYRFIQDTMNNILSENEKINTRLKQQDLILRSNFLMRLLKGRLDDKVFVTKALELYNLKFSSDYFAVILFYIVDFSSLFSSSDKEVTEEDFELVQFIVTNVAEELASRKNQGFVTEVDRMLACVINFTGADEPENKQDLLAIALEAAEFIRDKFEVDIMVSTSDVHKALFSIADAYQEALSVMEYKKSMESEEIISYDQIKSSGGSYNYSLETEHQLINCIKTGDFNSSKLIVDEVYNKNFSKDILSNNMVIWLLVDLASTMLKGMSEIGIAYDSLFVQQLNIMNRLLKCKKVKEMKQQMIIILQEICDYVIQNKKCKKDVLIKNTIEFIRCNYFDANLSVSTIADKFQLTPTYLTRLFKEQCGEGVFEYIIRVRMEKAKELLKDNKANIKDTAAKVGYYSSTAFIRAFKKIEGVTPGLYKDME